MLNELSENPTSREITDKSIIEKLINAKVNLGLSVPIKGRKIIKCTDELEEELFKRVKTKFQRRM